MDNGFGILGHHAQEHAEQGLGLDQQIPVLDHFMPGCHVLAVDQKPKAVKVSLIVKHLE